MLRLLRRNIVNRVSGTFRYEYEHQWQIFTCSFVIHGTFVCMYVRITLSYPVIYDNVHTILSSSFFCCSVEDCTFVYTRYILVCLYVCVFVYVSVWMIHMTSCLLHTVGRSIITVGRSNNVADMARSAATSCMVHSLCRSHKTIGVSTSQLIPTAVNVDVRWLEPVYISLSFSKHLSCSLWDVRLLQTFSQAAFYVVWNCFSIILYVGG